MKTVHNKFQYDTDTSTMIGCTGWITCWASDHSADQEHKTFYRTINGRYFSVAKYRVNPDYQWGFFNFFEEKPCYEGRNPDQVSWRFYDEKECLGWMQSYKIPLPQDVEIQEA